jgi:hypothetical protein
MADEVLDPQSGQSGGEQKTVLDGTNWSTFVPDDLKDDPNFAPFQGKEVGEVLRSFVNAQRMVGADKVIVPAGKNDTPEVWKGVFDRLGRPQNTEGYKFETPKLPEGMALNPELEKSFKEVSLFLGILPWQAEGIYKFYNDHTGRAFQDYQTKVSEAQRTSFEAAESALKKEYGSKYDEKVQLAKKVIRTYGGTPEEAGKFIDRFGNDPTVIKTLVSLGELISEDKLISGEKPDWDLAGDEARRKAVDIMSNETNPLNKAYHNRQHPQHEEAVSQVENYFRMSAG